MAIAPQQNQSNASATPSPMAIPTATNQAAPVAGGVTAQSPQQTAATIAAMQNSVIAQSSQAPGASTVPPVSTGVVSFPAGQGTQQEVTRMAQAQPGTVVTGQQTGSTAAGQGIASVPTQFQAYTAPPQPSRTQGAVPPPVAGTTYDAATGTFVTPQGTYLESLRGGTPTFTGSAATAQKYTLTASGYQAVGSPYSSVATTSSAVSSTIPTGMTQTDRNLINAATTPTTTGIASTATANQASNVLNNFITQAEASQPQISAAVKSANDAIQKSIDYANNQIALYQSYAADPSLDPKAKILFQTKAAIEEQTASFALSVQQKADAAIVNQEKVNKKLEGQARAAVNAAGMVGSIMGAGFIADQILNNNQAIQAIQAAATDSIRQAREALQMNELQLAGKQVDLYQSYNDKIAELSDKNAQYANQLLSNEMSMEQLRQDTAIKAQQYQANGMKLAQDRFDLFAKSKLAPEVIPQSEWQSYANDFKAAGMDISESALKNMYVQSIKDQNAKDAKQFNEQTQAFYQTAAQIKDPNAILSRPNLDGTFTQVKRSEVQTVPNYDTFQTTKNGKNYATYINKDNPTATPIEVALGDADKKITYKEDAIGNTIAITENADGTFSARKVLDFNGNPAGPVAVTNTIQNLESSNNSFSQTGGSITWLKDSKEGSVHLRNGAPAPECGQYVNDELGTRFPDSLDGKIKVCDPTLGTTNNPVKAGDAIVTAEAAGTGHVAIINSIYKGQDGKTYYQLSESNYKKNNKGQGIITNGRSIAADSNLIKGFALGKRELSTPNNGPQPPVDNGMAWTVNAPKDAAINTHVKNGTVVSIVQSSSFKDGSPMYIAQIKDDDTGTLINYSGIGASELRVGSSWGASSKPPTIGVTGSHDGFVVDLRNGNGSPMQPTGMVDTAKYGSWGSISSIPPKLQANIEKIRNDIEAGKIDLDVAVQRVKSDPLLSQVQSNVVLNDLASSFKFANDKKAQEQTVKDLAASEKKTEQQIDNERQLVSQLASDNVWGEQKGAYAKTRMSFNTLKNAVETGGGFNDLAALSAFAKMVDPNQRQITDADLRNVSSATSALNRLGVLPSKIASGDQLTEDGRKKLLEAATNQYGAVERGFFSSVADKATQALTQGIDPRKIVTIPPNTTFYLVDVMGNPVSTTNDLSDPEVMDMVKNQHLTVVYK